jgi:hypothetical protein
MNFIVNNSGRCKTVMRCLVPAVCLISISLTAGCGGDGLHRAPIIGVLTAEGAPVANAVVQFLPAAGTPGEGAIGNSDAAGRFLVISSRRKDEGIPPGAYNVRVTRMVNPDGTPLPPDAPDADYPESFESIPAPYSGVDSPLVVVIKPEGGEVAIELPVKPLTSRK